jgi:DNA-binding cell septation regulator SpoVG
MIHGLKVLRHANGYTVAMPQRKWRKGGHYTIAYPSTAEARRMIEEAVMAEYLRVTGEVVSTTRGPRALVR